MTKLHSSAATPSKEHRYSKRLTVSADAMKDIKAGVRTRKSYSSYQALSNSISEVTGTLAEKSDDGR